MQRNCKRKRFGLCVDMLEARIVMSASTLTSELDPESSNTQTSLANLTTSQSNAQIFTPNYNESSSEVTPQSNQSLEAINLPALQNDSRFAGIDGSGFTTVILDTGIDLDHPFFGPDNNGDGVADRIVFQYDFADGDANASDRNNHGSNVASIVGSQDAKYSGVAPGVDLVALKVFKDSGSGNFGYVEEALQWVIAHAHTDLNTDPPKGMYRFASVNLSLGDEANYQTEQVKYGISDELAALADMGIIVVSASGNDFFKHSSQVGVAYPAADANSLSIGATYDTSSGKYTYGSGAKGTGVIDAVAPFSQRHQALTTVFAPGAPVTGASKDGGLVTMHGTSQAAPHVAGLAALAQQLAVQELGRMLTVAEFTELIQQTGTKIVDGDDEIDNVQNTGLTFRRIDAVALADAIIAMKPDDGPSGKFSQVIDDEDSGYQATSGWQNWVLNRDSSTAVNNNYDYVAAGSGTQTASWTFKDLKAGVYDVSVSWFVSTHRASNARFKVYDGSRLLGTVTVDQRIDPNDFKADGQVWEQLGKFEITGNTLRVVLTNQADGGNVIADAARIDWVTEGAAKPEIAVSAGGSSLTSGGKVSLGTAEVGTLARKTITVSNQGAAPLTLTQLGQANMPSGFKLVSAFKKTMLAIGESTTFTVEMNTTTAGTRSGTLKILSTDSDESSFSIQLIGSVSAAVEAAPSPSEPQPDSPAPGQSLVKIIDNKDRGFALSSGWRDYTTPSGDSYNNDFIYAAARSNITESASWTFEDLPPSEYKVSVSWEASRSRPTNAPYMVYDGTKKLDTVLVNQRENHADFTADGHSWANLGTFTITGDMLRVRLTNKADFGNVTADAVRIERVMTTSSSEAAEAVLASTNDASTHQDFSLLGSMADRWNSIQGSELGSNFGDRFRTITTQNASASHGLQDVRDAETNTNGLGMTITASQITKQLSATASSKDGHASEEVVDFALANLQSLRLRIQTALAARHAQ